MEKQDKPDLINYISVRDLKYIVSMLEFYPSEDSKRIRSNIRLFLFEQGKYEEAMIDEMESWMKSKGIIAEKLSSILRRIEDGYGKTKNN